MAFRIRPLTSGLRGLTALPRLSSLQSQSRLISSTTHPQKPATPQTHPSSSSPTSTNDIEIEVLERTILRPERAEGTCSGTDNAVGISRTAYDPSTTTPESEFACFESEFSPSGRTDPLFISPANRDFSQLLSRELDGRAIEGDKLDRLGMGGSVRGWVKKGKEVKVRVIGKDGKGHEVWRRMRMGMGDEGDPFERLLRGLRRVQMRDQAERKEGSQKEV
ncbi:uncharacterized protein DSM5745_07901 [Aspergillus mulundensis]|uniref:Uncharacterized protein n=1 Tax=Aspergillus mulundensis TaxID=1810919 RepID=A0A3D8RFA5_9EURO|nr:Uncharacterized protein DSM5745_07901 [Aspergillus mulundensis]RDW72729.1 Uncharacterized protein DSM5745_07901 [Aspergillus mulundensis]